MLLQKPVPLFGTGIILSFGTHTRIQLTVRHDSDGRMSEQQKLGLMMIMWILLLLLVMKLWDLLNFMATFISFLQSPSGRLLLLAVMIFSYLQRFLTALELFQHIQ